MPSTPAIDSPVSTQPQHNPPSTSTFSLSQHGLAQPSSLEEEGTPTLLKPSKTLEKRLPPSDPNSFNSQPARLERLPSSNSHAQWLAQIERQESELSNSLAQLRLNRQGSRRTSANSTTVAAADETQAAQSLVQAAAAAHKSVAVPGEPLPAQKPAGRSDPSPPQVPHMSPFRSLSLTAGALRALGVWERRWILSLRISILLSTHHF